MPTAKKNRNSSLKTKVTPKKVTKRNNSFLYKNRNKLPLIIFLILFGAIGLWTLLRSQASVGGFNHPGILVSQGQLDFIKDKVARGEEPWISSYNKMKGSTLAKKTYTPSPVPKLLCSNDTGVADGFPQAGCDELNNDGAATYIQALMYTMTGEKVYADNAAKIIRAWSSTLKEIPYDEQRASNGNPAYWQNTLVVGWSTETMTRGAEIIRYTSDSMSSDDIKTSETWFKEKIYPFLANNEYIKYGNGNGGQTWTEALVNIGVYTNDRDIYNKGIKWYKSKSPQLVYLTKDGNKPYMATDPDTGKLWYGTVDEHWRNPIRYVNGQTTETCRDMGHAFMGLGPYANTAETALIQGSHDLYAENEERFLATFELNAGYVNQLLDRMAASGQSASQVSQSGWKPADSPCKKFSDGGQSAFLGTEIAYNHFVNRRGKSMPNTKRLMERVRPQSGGNHMFFETLTHANTGSIGITNTSPPSTSAEPIEESISLNAQDDTYVRDGKYADQSFAESKILPITNKNSSNGYTRYAYVKFDTSQIKGKDIKSANLQVNAKLTNSSFSKVEVFAVADSSWQGSSLSWNSKPQIREKVGEFVLNSTTSSWQNVDITNWSKTNLSKTSSHSFVFIAEKDNTGFAEFTSVETNDKPKIEAVVISEQSSEGSVPADTSPPKVIINVPKNNQAIVGKINVLVEATDDREVNKVELRIGDKLLLTKAGSVLSYGFDSKTVADGKYNLKATAYDSSGNTADADVSIEVRNNAPVITPPVTNNPSQPSLDTTPPSTPGSLGRSLVTNWGKARYDLKLNWKASSDNKGVKDYIVARDGLELGKTSGLTYTDNQLSSGTQYTYSVVARDEAGNTSSPAVSVVKVNCFLIWCSIQ